MLQRVDKFLIARHNRHGHNKINRFIASKPGFILTTLLAIYQAADEVADTWHEAHYVRSGIFSSIVVLLSFFALRHIIWNKRIEHFEYRLKIVEAAVLLYTGIEIWHRKASTQGYISVPSIVLAITTPCLVVMYLLQARLFYLKKKDLLPHG